MTGTPSEEEVAAVLAALRRVAGPDRPPAGTPAGAPAPAAPSDALTAWRRRRAEALRAVPPR